MQSYYWVKTFHIVFVVTWFAGLFYLPRLFVNLASVPPDSHAERERLLMMARKLYRFAGLLMIAAIALGLVLWLYYGIGRGPGSVWMHLKLALVIAAIGYHHACRCSYLVAWHDQIQLVVPPAKGDGRHPRDVTVGLQWPRRKRDIATGGE